MSNVISTSITRRIAIAFVVSLMTIAMVAGSLPLRADAALSESQIQSILGLLSSFGADQSTINNVNASLRGQPTTGGTTGGTTSGYTFTRNLSMGSTGEDVRQLQKVLNANGFMVSTSGAGSLGNESTYFGPATKAAVVKFQNANAASVLTPVGLTSGTGFVGASTRTKLNTMTGGTTGTPVPVTGSLSISLSSASPAQGAVISGQGIANLGSFVFVNGANVEAKVTKVTLNKAYISNDTAYSNVYLYDGGKRLTDAASVTSGVISFNDAAGLFMVPAGGSRTLSVRVDVASSATGQVMGVAFVSAEANVPVSGAFPITAAAQSVAGATLATVDFNTTTEPSATANVEPNNDVRLWQNTVSISQHKVKLAAMSFRNTGSAQGNEIINFDLYVNGNKVASVPTMDADRYVRFDFSSTPILLDTGSAIIKLEGDIVGGASRTFDFELRTTGDAIFYDNELNAAVVSTAAGSSFSARSGAVQTIASSTGGSVTVSKASSSPVDNVSTGASSVKLATYEFRGSGERMKIENLDVNVLTTWLGGVDNGKVYVNGAQVGSTKDLTEATDVNFTFGSSFIIDPGQTAVVDVYADTKSTTGTNLAADTTVAIRLGLGASNAQGMSSLQTTNVPGTDLVAGNTLTVKTATATVTKFSGYGNQTRPAGTQNVKMGSFVISSGSTEGLNVNTLVVDLSTNEAATVTNMRLVDNSTSATMGTAKPVPSTSNSYSVNLSIPKSGTKVIDIYADIISSSNIGPWIAEFGELTGNGQATAASVSVTDNVVLQTITVGSGTLSVTKGAGDPASNNVVAGTSGIKVGEFEFTALNSDFTVDDLIIKVNSGAATSVSAVKLRYQNAGGSTVESLATALAVPGSTNAYASATFTGLGAFIPSNTTRKVEVLADTATVDAGATSGQAIRVTLDYNSSFKALAPGQSPTTSVGSADVTSDGQFYVRKTIPTISRTLLTGNPTSGNAIYEFTIAADPAGRVDIKKLAIDIVTSGVTIADFYLREKGTSVDINDSKPATTDANRDIILYAGLQADPFDDDVIAISGGSSKTFQLFGTVTGWGDDGDSVTISFADSLDTTALAPTTSLGASGSVIWSDRSASSHTTITADWTNGYLLKDLGSDVQSFST